jgi:hypothetical protein
MGREGGAAAGGFFFYFFNVKKTNLFFLKQPNKSPLYMCAKEGPKIPGRAGNRARAHIPPPTAPLGMGRGRAAQTKARRAKVGGGGWGSIPSAKKKKYYHIEKIMYVFNKR